MDRIRQALGSALARGAVLVLAVVCWTAVALAGPPDPLQLAPATATGDPVADALLQLFAAFGGDWRAALTLAGLVAVANVATNLSKVPRVARWIEARGWKWTRPLLAVLAGISSGSIAAMALKMPLGPMIAIGALCGLGGIGGHELAQLRPAARRRRAQAATVSAAG
jgi:hypothetical protein